VTAHILITPGGAPMRAHLDGNLTPPDDPQGLPTNRTIRPANCKDQCSGPARRW